MSATGGGVPVVLPFLATQTRIRVAVSNNDATVKRTVEEVGEESNVKVDVGKACVGTAESAPVISANADNKNPKGEEEAITRCQEKYCARVEGWRAS